MDVAPAALFENPQRAQFDFWVGAAYP